MRITGKTATLAERLGAGLPPGQPAGQRGRRAGRPEGRVQLAHARTRTPTIPPVVARVTDPEVPKLIEAIYGCRRRPTPRNDLVEIFLTGITTKAGGPIKADLNSQLNNADVNPSDVPAVGDAAAEPGRAGRPPTRTGSACSAGDLQGFPNGRRLTDDVVDIELQALEGAAQTGKLVERAGRRRRGRRERQRVRHDVPVRRPAQRGRGEQRRERWRPLPASGAAVRRRVRPVRPSRRPHRAGRDSAHDDTIERRSSPRPRDAVAVALRRPADRRLADAPTPGDRGGRAADPLPPSPPAAQTSRRPALVHDPGGAPAHRARAPRRCRQGRSSRCGSGF